MNFACACQDHIFPARIQVGTPRDNQRNENGKCLMGKKNINNFYVHFMESHQDFIVATKVQYGRPFLTLESKE